MKYVIVKPNCREFANHVWNYLSIYAYGLETGARVYNPSFFTWHRYFNLSEHTPFGGKILLSLYGSYLIRARAACVRLTLGVMTYLPPTRPLVTNGKACGATYFIGWLFRNPVGLEKYRNELVSAFRPKEHVLNEVEAALAPFGGKRLIGVHLRQQPYKGFGDDFLVPLPRVRRIIEEYLYEKKWDIADVALVIVSDNEVDPAAFKGFASLISHENEVPNLFLLSKCSAVIGTNSSFSNLAAWFGNVPHIVTTNEPIDWEYYRSRATYFENKYATFAQ